MKTSLGALSILFAKLIINNVSGFRKTDIFPYNANIFSEDELSPSFVADRLVPKTVELEKDRPRQAIMSNTEPNPILSVSTSQAEPEPGTSNNKTS